MSNTESNTDGVPRKVRLGMVGGGPRSNIVPTVEDGVLGVKFVEAAVESHQQDGAWVNATVDLSQNISNS